MPTEVDPAVPFAEDHHHASYDAGAVNAFWRQLIQADRVITRFRSEFLGKVNPVHFFWGAMDLACTRFSGRTAPTHPGGAPNCADWVMEEGYSHDGMRQRLLALFLVSVLQGVDVVVVLRVAPYVCRYERAYRDDPVTLSDDVVQRKACEHSPQTTARRSLNLLFITDGNVLDLCQWMTKWPSLDV